MKDELIQKMCVAEGQANAFGNTVYRGCKSGDRYYYDFGVCASNTGWTQYDTTQDAWYFGVWVNLEERAIFTFAEGDISLVMCPTKESFKAELDHMASFYGEPPPSFVAYSEDADGKMTKTEVYDKRPSVDLDWVLAVATGNGSEDEVVGTYVTKQDAEGAIEQIRRCGKPSTKFNVYRVWGPNGNGWQEYES